MLKTLFKIATKRTLNMARTQDVLPLELFIIWFAVTINKIGPQ